MMTQMSPLYSQTIKEPCARTHTDAETTVVKHGLLDVAHGRNNSGYSDVRVQDYTGLPFCP